MTNIVILPRATALYPNLLEPKAFMKNGKPAGEPNYSLMHLFDPTVEGVVDGLNEAKAAAIKACQEEWPNRDVIAAIKAGEIQWPFKDGNKLAAAQENKGKKGDFYWSRQVLKASSTFEPGVFDKGRNEILNPKQLYSGMVVRTEVNFKAGTANGDYVKAYLNNVLKVDEGTKIGGRSAAQIFEGIEEPAEIDDGAVSFNDAGL